MTYKNQVQNMLLNNKNINQNISDIIKLLQKNDLNELKKYIEEHHLNLRDLHSNDFDSLTIMEDEYGIKYFYNLCQDIIMALLKYF
ncbi:hypothetical protein PIROE2DRAFT_5030 [Piromyces sp. E2]|nr:hypothetical protein PIROE2DRAFT_5030 [Piromyces sp. E2]|eukprot:OUM67503.1 hypothetical protein PIROE2DRAFT_5030 [Piromyces sp. E2]